jgi:colicin import membrane protein
MALAQEAEPGEGLARVLARTRAAPRVGGLLNQPRGNNYGPARTDAAAEAAEAAAAQASAAVETSADAEAAAAARAAAKATADAPGARAALAPELPKEPGGGADGMAEDAEEIPGRPVFSVGAQEELKTRGGPLSSEGANAAVQAERSKPIIFLDHLSTVMR